MPAKNVELRRNISGSFTNDDSLTYIKAHWDLVVGKPSVYSPATHEHNADDITAGTLNVDRIPTLPQSKITNLVTDLAAKALKENSVYYVQGNTTGTAGVWTGTISEVTSLYVGLAIAYKIGIAGAAGGTTLNINNLGAVACRINNSTLTTHFAQDFVIILVYDGTFWRTFDYNTNTTYSVILQTAIDAGTETTGGLITAKLLQDNFLKINAIADWAKAANKPSYNQDEVSDGSTYKRVTQTEKNAWDGKLSSESDPIFLTHAAASVTITKMNNWDAAYTHAGTAHAPSNAQKNSDITKAEIEAKLTGEITSHTHALVAANSTTLGSIKVHSQANTQAAVSVPAEGSKVASRQYSVQLNASGEASVYVPWVNTTYATFTNAVNGLVPTPGETGSTKYLRQDGTWVVPPSSYTLPTAANGTLGGIEIGYVENAKNYAVKLSGNQAYVTVPWENTVYSLPLATSGARGGVRIGYTTNAKNYAVQLSSEQMYVNVPWENTTYSAFVGATAGANGAEGLVPQPFIADRTKVLRGNGFWEHITKTELGLENVTNNTQIKKQASATTVGNIPTWGVTTGDELGLGYTVQTTLSSSTTALVRADAIATALGNKLDVASGRDIRIAKATNKLVLNGTTDTTYIESDSDDAVNIYRLGTAVLSIGATVTSMGTRRLINVVDPVDAQDAATKKYVDDNAGSGHYTGYPQLPLKPLSSGIISNLPINALSTAAMSANQIYVAPFIPSNNFTADRFTLYVSTAGETNGVARIVVYEADANGRPSTCVFASAEIITASVTGALTAISTYAFTKGKLYFIGIWVGGATATFRTAGATGATPLSWNVAATPTANMSLIRPSSTYAASGLAPSWTFANAHMATTLPPIISMQLTSA